MELYRPVCIIVLSIDMTVHVYVAVYEVQKAVTATPAGALGLCEHACGAPLRSICLLALRALALAAPRCLIGICQ